MDTYALQMKGIVKEFPGVKALDNVTFSVKRGRFMPFAEKMVRGNQH